MYENADPAATVGAEDVFTIERSFTAVTVVVAVEVLGVVGSASVAVTVAVLEIDPPFDGAVTLMVIAGAAATARDGRVQVTVPEALLQVQPVPVADPNVTPAGRTSTTLKFEAALGPALVTLIV